MILRGTPQYGNFLIGWYQQKCSDHDALKRLLVFECRSLLGAISLETTRPLANRLKEIEDELESLSTEVEIHNEAAGENIDAVIDDEVEFIKGDSRVMEEAHRAIAKAINKANEKLSPDVRVFFNGDHVDIMARDTVVARLRHQRLPRGSKRFFQRELQNAMATTTTAWDEIPALTGLSANAVGAMLRGEEEPKTVVGAYDVIHKILHHKD